MIVEAVILLSASKPGDGGKILCAAAQASKVYTAAITLKPMHEIRSKEMANREKKPQAATKPAQRHAAELSSMDRLLA